MTDALPRYEIVRLPFSQPIEELSRKEARLFFYWFLEHRQERLQQLQNAIDSGRTFPFVLDFDPGKLDLLGVWLDRHTTTEPLSEELREKYRGQIGQLNSPLSSLADKLVSQPHMSEETYSLSFDLGIYFGEMLLRLFPTSEWIFPRRSPSDVAYNYPALRAGSSKRYCSPSLIARVIGSISAERRESYKELPRIFQVWQEYFQDWTSNKDST